MVDRPDARAASGSMPTTPDDRRRRVALRRLVDEMLDEIRAAANEDNWTAVSRSQAEADLARIMTQVRREATKRPGSDKRGAGTAARGSKREAKRGAPPVAKRASSARAKQSAERTAKPSAKRSATKKASTRKRTKSR